MTLSYLPVNRLAGVGLARGPSGNRPHIIQKAPYDPDCRGCCGSVSVRTMGRVASRLVLVAGLVGARTRICLRADLQLLRHSVINWAIIVAPEMSS